VVVSQEASEVGSGVNNRDFAAIALIVAGLACFLFLLGFKAERDRAADRMAKIGSSFGENTVSNSSRMVDRVAALAENERKAFANSAEISSVRAVDVSTPALPKTFATLVSDFGMDVVIGLGFVLLVIFLLFVVVFYFSFYRNRGWARTSSVSYECGAEPQLSAYEQETRVSFFKLLLVFLVFELEIIVLFLILPRFHAVTLKGLFCLLAFMALVQLSALVEIKGGAFFMLQRVFGDNLFTNKWFLLLLFYTCLFLDLLQRGGVMPPLIDFWQPRLPITSLYVRFEYLLPEGTETFSLRIKATLYVHDMLHRFCNARITTFQFYFDFYTTLHQLLDCDQYGLLITLVT